ncbi:MAG: hypothetical protein ACK53A_14645 [Gemmatimonadota bacterium]
MASSDGQSWLAVAHVPASNTGSCCGLTGVGTTSPAVSLLNGIPGWFFYLVAVY